MINRKPSWLTSESWELVQKYDIQIKGRTVGAVMKELEALVCSK